MFKAWNIVNNLLGGSAFGHVLWETKLLTEELRRRGTEPRVLGHNSIKAETYPGARVIPAFDLHYAHPISEDPEWGYFENFVVQSGLRKGSREPRQQGLADALTVFVDIGERQLLGAVRWLRRFDEAPRPHVAMILQGKRGMVLKGQNEWSKTNPGPDMYRKIWAGSPSAVKRHITLCARSDMYLSGYEQIFGQTPHVLPFAMGPTDREFNATKARIGSPEERPLIVSFLAGSRLERGAGLIPDVVKQCAPLGTRFLIQLSDVEGATSDLADSLRALRERADVRFHEGMLSREEYNDWVAQSVVLLPYDGSRYQSRSSGVYVEAKCFGSPVIVPAGTWMADEVSRLGNGLAFEDYTAASIAKCIARAQMDLASLRERAAVCAAEYRREQGADRFIEALENLVETNRSIPA